MLATCTCTCSRFQFISLPASMFEFAPSFPYQVPHQSFPPAAATLTSLTLPLSLPLEAIQHRCQCPQDLLVHPTLALPSSTKLALLWAKTPSNSLMTQQIIIHTCMQGSAACTIIHTCMQGSAACTSWANHASRQKIQSLSLSHKTCMHLIIYVTH